MRPDRSDPSKPRRDFFKKTALLATALFGCRPTPTAAADPAPKPRRGGRYRLTNHIRRYYERASL